MIDNLTLDLRKAVKANELYKQAVEHINGILSCLIFQRYCDEHDKDDDWVEIEIEEHYMWLNKYTPHMVKYADQTAVLYLTKAR